MNKTFKYIIVAIVTSLLIVSLSVISVIYIMTKSTENVNLPFQPNCQCLSTEDVETVIVEYLINHPELVIQAITGETTVPNAVNNNSAAEPTPYSPELDAAQNPLGEGQAEVPEAVQSATDSEQDGKVIIKDGNSELQINENSIVIKKGASEIHFEEDNVSFSG
jgi:hypothetical protein